MKRSVVSVVLVALWLGSCSPSAGVGTSAEVPDPGTAVIAGMVWLDVCDPTADDPVPDGCVVGPYGDVIGNGVADLLDPVAWSAWLVLWSGSCPGEAAVSARASETDGRYEFTGLTAGEYCLVIDPTVGDNKVVLGPGVWSLPAVYASGPALIPIILGPGEEQRAVNLAYDPAAPTAP